MVAGDFCIVVRDNNLTVAFNQADRQQLVPGRDIGIIAYHNTPFKAILAGGITTLSTDFTQMGKTMANLIEQQAIHTIEHPWKLTIRKSL